MATIKPPASFIKPAEIKIAKVCFFIACICAIPIPNLFIGGHFNAYLLRMIPSGFLPLFFTLPIVIYYAFIVSGKVKFNDRLKENHDAFERGKKRRIVFRAKFKPQPHEGTVWKLRNCNQFVWTKTTVLIERRVGEAVDNEKHDLGVVTGGENVVIESKLSPQDLAHWRIMVICPQGRLINFPEQWVEAIPEAKTEEIMEELPA